MIAHARQSPKVSIGLPVYNGAAYLRAALDSLLAQTFTDFELVISDNASTDETEAICREYAADDARIRYERSPENVGCIGNFNRSFELCRGEYFKWAACDDLCAPTFLERLVEVLDTRPDVLWCHSGTLMIDPKDRILPHQGVPAGTNVDEVMQRPYVRTVKPGFPRMSQRASRRLYDIMVGSPACHDIYGLIRRAALEQTRLNLPLYGSEKILLAELALRGGYHQIDELLFFCRASEQGSGSLTTAEELQQFVDPHADKLSATSRREILKAYWKALQQAPLSFSARAACYSVLLRYICQCRKWVRVVRQKLFGIGNGGGYVDWLAEARELDGIEQQAGRESVEVESNNVHQRRPRSAAMAMQDSQSGNSN